MHEVTQAEPRFSSVYLKSRRSKPKSLVIKIRLMLGWRGEAANHRHTEGALGGGVNGHSDCGDESIYIHQR